MVALAKIAEDPFLEADGLSEIGKHLSWQGKNEQARKSLEHALTLCLSLPYKSGELDTLIRLAAVAGSQENHAESIDYEDQALQLSRLMGDVAKESLVLGNMAVSLAVLGDLIGRQRYQKEALAIRRRLNLPSDICMTVGELGYTSIELGDYDSAESFLTEALEIAIQIKDEFWQAWVQLRLGHLWYERGDLEKSLPLIMEAFQTVERLQNIPLQVRVLYDWGNVLVSQGDWKGAEQKFQGAYDLWHARGKMENSLLALAGRRMWHINKNRRQLPHLTQSNFGKHGKSHRHGLKGQISNCIGYWEWYGRGWRTAEQTIYGKKHAPCCKNEAKRSMILGLDRCFCKM